MQKLIELPQPLGPSRDINCHKPAGTEFLLDLLSERGNHQTLIQDGIAQMAAPAAG
jgi:hypothetical protein